MPKQAAQLPLEIIEQILSNSSTKDAVSFVTACKEWYATAQHIMYKTYHISIPENKDGDFRQHRQAFERHADDIKSIVIMEQLPEFPPMTAVLFDEKVREWSQRNTQAVLELCSPRILNNVKSIEMWPLVSTVHFGLNFSDIEKVLQSWIFALGRQIMLHCKVISHIRIVHRWENISGSKAQRPGPFSPRKMLAVEIDDLLEMKSDIIFPPISNGQGSLVNLTLEFAPFCSESVAVSRVWTRYFARSLIGLQTLVINQNIIRHSTGLFGVEIFRIGYDSIAFENLQELIILTRDSNGCYYLTSEPYFETISYTYPKLTKLGIIAPNGQMNEYLFGKLFILQNLKVLELQGYLCIEADNTVDSSDLITESPPRSFSGQEIGLCDEPLIRALCRIACQAPNLEMIRLRQGSRCYYQCEMIKDHDESRPKGFRTWKKALEEGEYIDDFGFPSSLTRLADLSFSQIQNRQGVPGKSSMTLDDMMQLFGSLDLESL